MTSKLWQATAPARVPASEVFPLLERIHPRAGWGAMTGDQRTIVYPFRLLGGVETTASMTLTVAPDALGSRITAVHEQAIPPGYTIPAVATGWDWNEVIEDWLQTVIGELEAAHRRTLGGRDVD